MFIVIASVVVLAVAGVLAVAAAKPGRFRVERASRMSAPPEAIFAAISDFRRWAHWSPWENRDPALKRTFSGPASGTGAVYEWQGNKQVGKGRMEIMEATAPSRLRIKLDFFEPFEAHNMAEFSLASKDGSTEVTWAMHGPLPYMAKVMSLFCNMDRMVGKDFEAGLTQLKALTEKDAAGTLAASAR
jgi:uncharacterized protein YndB with AHSA1/START domain